MDEDECPWSPMDLEIHEFLQSNQAATPELPRRYKPDELVVRHKLLADQRSNELTYILGRCCVALGPISWSL